MPPEISQCPLVESHWLRLPRKQMLRDIFALILWERKHSHTSCTLSAFSWNENVRLQNKRPLWKLVLHYLRVTSGEALHWTLWIPFTAESRLCRGFLNNIWSTMYFYHLVVSKHGCCQNHWCQALGLEESHLVEIGWSPQASMFCNHQLMMSEVLNPLWIVVCIGETTQVARFISSWMFIVCPYRTRTHSRQWEYHGKRMMRSLPWM